MLVTDEQKQQAAEEAEVWGTTEFKENVIQRLKEDAEAGMAIKN